MTAKKPLIIIADLKKTFRVNTSSKGFLGQFQSFFFPRYQTVTAVNSISFDIRKGERVALIGPNGAGKSTTIKMMTGILYPDAGTISVNGFNPISQRKKLAHKIGTVIGHRSQLWYHLPAIRSFRLLATIYGISRHDFSCKLKELSVLLQLEQLIQSPVKELSLGQRMRCELAASLLHSPDIMFFDEPTIGLDVVSKSAIRKFIRNCSEKHGTTVFLTSHDTSDIEVICDRVIIIDNGNIVTDSELSEIKNKYLTRKRIKVKTNKPTQWHPYKGIEVKDASPLQATLEVNLQVLGCSSAIQKIIDDCPVVDITVEDPPLEEIIKQIYVGE
jgi:viologen exporter family transport system ATP-binding protein